MRLKVTSFKCYKDLDVTFEDGEVTLLKGQSGSGKSTIPQAITWCLFGKLKIKQLPDNKEKKKGKLTVSLTISKDDSDVIIYRHKKPACLLQVTVIPVTESKDGSRKLDKENKEVFEDAVAQTMINDMFCDVDLWPTIGYIGQRSQNSLLSPDCKSSKKMEIINTLAFKNDNPDEIIERITTELKTVSEDYHSSKIKIESLKEEMDNFTSDKKIDISHACDEDVIKSMEKQLKTLKKEILVLREKQLQQRELKGVITSLTESVQRHQKDLDKIDIPDNVDDLESKVTEYQSMSSKLDLYNQYIKSLVEVNDKVISISKGLDPNFITMVQDDVTTLLNQLIIKHKEVHKKEALYQQHSSKALSLKIAYDSDIINDMITKITELLAAQEPLRVNAQIEELETKLSKIEKQLKLSENKLEELNDVVIPEIVIPPQEEIIFPEEEVIPEEVILPQEEIKITEYKDIPIDMESLTNAELKLKDLIACKDLLSCPHCQKSVSRLGNKLVISDGNPVDPLELTAAKDLVDNLRNDIERIKKKNKDGKKNVEMLIKEATDKRERKIKTIKDERERKIKSMKDERERKIKSIKDERDKKIRSLREERDKQVRSNERAKEKEQETIDELDNKKNKINKELKSLKKTIVNSELMLLERSTERELERKLDNLKSIIIVEVPELSSDKISKMLDYCKHYNHYVSIKNLCPEKPVLKKKEINNLLEDLNKEITKFKSLSHQKDHLTTLFNRDNKSLNAKLKLVDDQVTDILESKIELEDKTNKKVNNSKLANQLVAYKTKYQKIEKKLSNNHQRMTALECMKEIALKTECTTLDATIDNINSVMADIVTTLFEKPMIATIQLTKTLGNGRVKPCNPNISLIYDGEEFDMKDLSGGEADRISLALTLALNRISGCPLLILDESMASLDANSKELCLKAIKLHAAGKTVICINHEGVEGTFNKVIEVRDFKVMEVEE